MSPAMLKMWISLGGIALMFVSVILVLINRTYVKNRILSFILSSIAFVMIVLCGLIMFVVVFSGPSGG
ncbi:MAG: DUF2768 domain-containing protein [Bacilli bacterium]